MSTNKDIFNQNDFVYLKNGDTIESSGYKINSLLMSSEMSPMTTINQVVNTNQNQSGGSVSSILNDLAVPAGLLLLQQKSLKHYNENSISNDNQVIHDDLFDKLFKLSQPIKNKKLTKRNKLKKHGRKTKRVK